MPRPVPRQLRRFRLVDNEEALDHIAGSLAGIEEILDRLLDIYDKQVMKHG